MSNLKGKSFLVVDDEAGIRDLIISELEFCGASCKEASNGNDAFELYKKQKFDAVISDIRMPNGDGIFFLNKIKDAKLPMTVIIFMTGFSEVPAEDIYDMGVEAIVAKPFRLDHLVGTLELAMKSPRVIWRREPRVVNVRNINLNIPKKANPVSAKTFNIGRGGLFIQLSQSLPEVGDKVSFELVYDQDSDEPKKLKGQLLVRWVREETVDSHPPGFGGEFTGMTQEALDEIAGLSGLYQKRGFIPKS